MTLDDSLGYRELTVADLRKAVEIYLLHAYPAGGIPERVAQRLNWPQDVLLADLLAGPAFEKAGASNSGAPIHAIRLGNLRYPHMKLQLQPWPTLAGYMLSVNTHDQIAGLPLKAPDAQQFEQLQRDNQRIKESVENAWDSAGFPTFLRYLRDFIAQRDSNADTVASDDTGG